MKEIYNSIIQSFNNKDEGFSARKLSAFAGVMMAIYLSVKHTTEANEPTIVTVWLLFSLLCLGIITMAEVIKFKNGGNAADVEPK